MSNQIGHVRERLFGAVYVGRAVPRRRLAASPLGNPFTIGRNGERDVVIAQYAQWLIARVRDGDRRVIGALIECRDRPLACWCRTSDELGPACHADVIADVLATFTDDELRAFVREAA